MEKIIALDQLISLWIQQHGVTGALSPLMIFLSHIGNLGLIWIVTALIMICTKTWRRAGIAIGIALLCSVLVGNGILKHSIMRLRPCIDFPGIPLLLSAPAATDFSFPSGHAFSSFAAAAAMSGALTRPVRWAVLALAAAIGFSRIYLFMHYPSDVLAGAVLGLLFGHLAWQAAGPVMNFWKKKLCRKQAAGLSQKEST